MLNVCVFCFSFFFMNEVYVKFISNLKTKNMKNWGYVVKYLIKYRAKYELKMKNFSIYK